MKKEKTIEQIHSIISKENLIELYIKERKNKLEICSILNICEESLNKILKSYGIDKRSNKYKSAIWLKDNIDIEEFKHFYNQHNIKQTAQKYNTTVNIITEFCKIIKFKKEKEDIIAVRNENLKKSDKLKFNIILKDIDPKELELLYITNGYTYDEVANYYNVSRDIMVKIIKYYGLKKDRSEIIKKTLNKKYEDFGSHEEYHKYQIEKRTSTWESKYGSFENYLAQRQKKITTTNINTYGVPAVMSNKSIRSKQARSASKSKLEKRVSEFLIQNGFNFIQSYTIKKDNLLHAFDIAVLKDESLELLIDCDGVYYHGYLNDNQSYPDEYRSSLVPEGVKFITVVEGNEEEAYKEILKLYDLSYDDYIKEIFSWCRSIEFPYPQYVDKVLNNSFNDLNKSNLNNFNINVRTGDKIIYNFHPSIWKCNRKNKLSPYKAWQDDKLLLKCIKNRIIYKGSNLDRSKVLTGFTISGIAPKVSIFNPNLAKYIGEKYLGAYDEIFDPCSGYSGRMLGICSLGKKYIGQDINITTVEESNNIIDYFNLNATVKVKNLLEDSGEYECLFTCPPYGDKENWGQKIESKSCDEWIDEIISRYKCKEYIFVVDKTEKYQDCIVEELKNKSHFSINKEYIIKISKNN